MFDLISTEYGWSDEVLLALPLARVRQIREVLTERRSLEDYRHRSYLEWQTRTLAAFFAAATDSKKAAEAVVEAANDISLTTPPKPGSEAARKASLTGPPSLDHLPPDDDPERAARNAEINRRREAGEGSPGGFEQMRGLFGGDGMLRGGANSAS